jgi:pyruvate dehydrogenase complex dehydrogenase (E1) component
VILAKTVKGWTLGTGAEARNMTHQKKEARSGGTEEIPRHARAADPGQEDPGSTAVPSGTG